MKEITDLNPHILRSYMCESIKSKDVANVRDITEILQEVLQERSLEYICGGGDAVSMTEEQLRDLYYQTCETLDDSWEFLFCKVLDFLDDNNLCYLVNTEEGDTKQINCSQQILFFELFSGKINIDMGV